MAVDESKEIEIERAHRLGGERDDENLDRLLLNSHKIPKVPRYSIFGSPIRY